MAPFLHELASCEFRHLSQSVSSRSPVHAHRIVLNAEGDTLLRPGAPRPGIGLEACDARREEAASHRYIVTHSPEVWLMDLPDWPVLLHIDMDYFNNRFDRDSDWQKAALPRHDPDLPAMIRASTRCSRPSAVQELEPGSNPSPWRSRRLLPSRVLASHDFAAHDKIRRHCPGQTVSRQQRRTTMSKPKRKPSKRSTGKKAMGASSPKPKSRESAVQGPKTEGRGRTPIDAASVGLIPGKGSAGRGGDSGGHYWHIHAGEARAGYVYINIIDEPPFGKHPLIQIHINQSSRGRGIGRIAYRAACEASGHDMIIVHMRKSNVASQRAAAAAGFEVVDDPAIAQLAMAWRRRK